MADESLEAMMGKVVVFDTGTPIVYLGTLVDITDHTFVIEDADMHDCRDGHANKEAYLAEAHEEGITVNRRRTIVMRSAVISAALLEDIVNE